MTTALAQDPQKEKALNEVLDLIDSGRLSKDDLQSAFSIADELARDIKGGAAPAQEMGNVQAAARESSGSFLSSLGGLLKAPTNLGFALADAITGTQTTPAQAEALGRAINPESYATGEALQHTGQALTDPVPKEQAEGFVTGSLARGVGGVAALAPAALAGPIGLGVTGSTMMAGQNIEEARAGGATPGQQLVHGAVGAASGALAAAGPLKYVLGETGPVLATALKGGAEGAAIMAAQDLANKASRKATFAPESPWDLGGTLKESLAMGVLGGATAGLAAGLKSAEAPKPAEIKQVEKVAETQSQVAQSEAITQHQAKANGYPDTFIQPSAQVQEIQKFSEGELRFMLDQNIEHEVKTAETLKEHGWSDERIEGLLDTIHKARTEPSFESEKTARSLVANLPSDVRSAFENSATNLPTEWLLDAIDIRRSQREGPKVGGKPKGQDEASWQREVEAAHQEHADLQEKRWTSIGAGKPQMFGERIPTFETIGLDVRELDDPTPAGETAHAAETNPKLAAVQARSWQEMIYARPKVDVPLVQALGLVGDSTHVPPGMGHEVPGDPILAAPTKVVGQVPLDAKEGIYGTLETTLEPKKPMQARTVIDALSRIPEALGAEKLAIRYGHLGAAFSGAMGRLKPGPWVARVRSRTGIMSAAHEVGEAIFQTIEKTPDAERGFQSVYADPVIRGEWERIGKHYYPDATGDVHLREGVAEWLAHYAVQREFARGLAPEATKWFEQKYLMDHPALSESIDKAHDLAREYRFQGAQNIALGSQLKPTKFGERYKALRASLRPASLIYNWVSSIHALKLESARYEDISGNKLMPEQDPWQIVKADSGKASNTSGKFEQVHVTDLYNRPTFMSLKDAVAPAKGLYDKLRIYLHAKRSLAIQTEKGKEDVLSLEVADSIVRQIEGDPQLRGVTLASENLYKWWGAVNDYACQLSPGYRAWYEYTHENDAGFYVPLKAALDDVEEAYVKSGRPSAGAFIKSFKGSTKQRVDPIQSMIAEGRRRVSMAYTERAREAMDALYQEPGMGSGWDDITDDISKMIPVAEKSFASVFKQIQSFISEQGGKPVELPEGITMDDLAGQTAMLYARTYEVPGDRYIITRWRRYMEGDTLVREPRYYEVRGDVYRAMFTGDEARHALWVRAARSIIATPFNIAFKAGAVARPSFAFVNEQVRNLMYSSWATRSDNKGVTTFASEAFLHQFSMMTHAVMGTLHTAADNLGLEVPASIRASWKAAGGRLAKMTPQAVKDLAAWENSLIETYYNEAMIQSSHLIGHRQADPASLANTMLSGRKVRPIKTLVDMWHGLTELSNVPDAAVRMTEMRRVGEKNGWKVGQPMTQPQMILASIAAKQVGTDFWDTGKMTRGVNQWMPFFGVPLQSGRDLLAQFKRDPKGQALRAAVMVTLPTVIYWYKRKDDRDYQDAKPEARLGKWLYPIDGPRGEKELWAMPKPHQLGTIAGDLPEMILNGIYNGKSEFTPTQLGRWLDQFMPSIGAPVLIKEGVEQWANKDTYSGNAIESDSMKRVDPEQRYTPYTSELAIRMGSTFGVSPVRADHALRSFMGGAVQEYAAIIGMGTGNPAVIKDKRAFDLPLVGKTFIRGGQMSPYTNRYVEQLYDMSDSYTMAANSGKEKDETTRQIRLMLGDATKAISMWQWTAMHAPTRLGQQEADEHTISISKEAVQMAISGQYDRVKYQQYLREASQKKGSEKLKERAAALGN